MIFLFYGADSYRSKKQLDKFIAEFKSRRDPQGLNICVCDGRTQTAEEVLQSATASPFLGEKRLTVICAISENKDERSQDILLSALEGGAIPDTSVILFWESKDFEKNPAPLFAFLIAQKYSQQFTPFAPENLAEWLQKAAQQYHVGIDVSATRELLEVVGADMYLLELELAKCASLARADGKDFIDVRMVRALNTVSFDDNMFHCIDAILAGRTHEALQMLHGQWTAGNSEQEVFGALIWQMRVLLEAKHFMMNHGERALSGAASALGIHPFVIKKITPLLMRIPFSAFSAAFADLLRIDTEVKSGTGTFRITLDQFIIAFSERVRA